MNQQQAYTHNLSIVEGLQPVALWQWFARICSIAHPSHYEAQLASYIVDWAMQQGLSVTQDSVGNITITKPASAGMQQHVPIALQAHLDMVPQSDKPYDFTCQPIILRKNPDDANFLMATGTTLGADNGIGMASCLAVLQSDTIQHPPIQVLLTMTEETGMVGAMNLAPKTVSAPWLINTDTEEIGEVYVGCAGGIDADISLDLHYQRHAFDAAMTVRVGGLQGGHSGIDIHKNRGNAIVLLARILAHLDTKHPHAFGLSRLSGGSLRNAIARSAQVQIVCAASDMQVIQQSINSIMDTLRDEMRYAEPNFQVDITQDKVGDLAIANTSQVIDLLNALPNGVVRYSDVATDTVETSLSVGQLVMDHAQLKVIILVRSLIESVKYAVCQQLSSLAALAGAQITFDTDYTGWNPSATSALTDLVVERYTQILGRAPQVKVIHAGLECGLMKRSHPTLDMVSIGPTIKNAHSPVEMVDIDSVATYWQLLLDVLANAPKADSVS